MYINVYIYTYVHIYVCICMYMYNMFDEGFSSKQGLILRLILRYCRSGQPTAVG